MINSDLNRELLRIAARSHFWAFCCYFDYEFFAVKRRFLKEVALAFQEVIDEYEKGNKLCVKVWKDYNLAKYPKDDGFRIGDYNVPVK